MSDAAANTPPATASTAPSAAGLGRAIRAARIERGMSLSQLALAAAVDKGYLSRVERGLKVPSVAVVLRISSALDMSAAQLFGAAENEEAVFLTRAGNRAGLTVEDQEYHIEVLTRAASSTGLEVFLMFPPLEFPEDHKVEHRGDELLYVVRGPVEVRFPDRVVELATGDSAQFRGDLPHQVRRLSEDGCILVVVSGS
ncbi:helix-turn-helix domain-containing protein [Acuticoccus sediminis]|nr:XRE family transcriptional regulator [Acuticoccus sediminis]